MSLILFLIFIGCFVFLKDVNNIPVSDDVYEAIENRVAVLIAKGFSVD